ncbi:MAG: DUF819 family protein, partial [Acidobacteriota bacterium]|nr:DUF819 family protein [Acidobacteriota bacterium]
METWVRPDDHWALWTVLLAAGAFGIWAERTRWGARVSGAVVAIGTALVLSNLGLIPVRAPAYDVVWSYLVPLAIPLLLLRADLKRILTEAGPTLLAFTAGGIGTVLGTCLAFWLIPLGEEGWELAGIFCATYVGGSMNFVAASEALGLRSGDLLSAGFAADNLVMAAYFLVLFALPGAAVMRRWLGERRVPADGHELGKEAAEPAPPPTLSGMAAALAVSAGLCAAGFACEALTGFAGSGILFLTGFTVLVATLVPAVGRLGGASEVGTLMMHVFFAVIGASAHIATVLEVGPVLFLFAALILTVHLAFLL